MKYFLVFCIYIDMKKTRFFYGKNFWLLVLLGWLLLLNAAAELNLGEGGHIEDKQESRQENAADEMSVSESEMPSMEAGTPSGERETLSASAATSAEDEMLSAEKQASRQQDTDGVENGEEALESKFENPDIRVLLMDSDYKTYYHPSVTVTANGKTMTFDGNSPELSDGSLVLDGKEDGIQVSSIKRMENPPIYKGTLEIRKTTSGLLLINALPLETYLEAVVPSEMPASYEMEALKAQAVCARTYARKQMEEGSLEAEYGADVDDSVNYQVYGNFYPKEQSSQAVKETAGQVLRQNGELINAYYFSTSAGATSTDEIWGADEAAPYLKSVSCSFDAEEPWSRWSVEIPWSAVNDRTGILEGCSGELLSLQIVKKNQSGAVTGLLVTTEGGSCQLSQEYEIRQLLSPQGCMITEMDGTETKGGTLLPSAYFTLDVEPGSCFTVTGSGYGHGVGMSQTAANEMAKEGYAWEEILNYFFQNIQIGI